MMLPLKIALAHLRARKRQTLVSVLGVTLGVGVFIAITGMMRGFHDYFLKQIVETNPHIRMTDEVRHPAPQPLQLLQPGAAVEIRRILPRDPVRGIGGAAAIVASISSMPGLTVAPSLSGQAILRRAGRDYAVSVRGVDAVREPQVTSIAEDMVQGSLAALASQPDGVIIGSGLQEKMGAAVGDMLAAATQAGGDTTLRVVGIFHTGLEQQDNGQIYVSLAKQQSMQARPRVVNEIGIRLADITRSIPVAREIENRFGYKTAPWEETYSRILEVFVLQNVIIYLATGAVLVVAGFGIFNIISTVVLEKGRDIAIMRSVGMPRASLVAIFVIEGTIVGILGVVAGWALGWTLSGLLAQLPAPGAGNAAERLQIAQSLSVYGLASLIALVTSVGAAWLPARRAAATDPLLVIRGAT